MNNRLTFGAVMAYVVVGALTLLIAAGLLTLAVQLLRWVW